MIGRFSRLNTYRELFEIKDIVRVILGGFPALVGFLMGFGTGVLPWAGNLLILISVGINGFPIIRGAVAGLIEKKNQRG